MCVGKISLLICMCYEMASVVTHTYKFGKRAFRFSFCSMGLTHTQTHMLRGSFNVRTVNLLSEFVINRTWQTHTYSLTNTPVLPDYIDSFYNVIAHERTGASHWRDALRLPRTLAVAGTLGMFLFIQCLRFTANGCVTLAIIKK